MFILKQGSTGPYVQMLQLALERAGYSVGTKDGIFGSKTKESVISFQKANGLVTDGIVGMLTWSRLTPYIVGYIVHTIGRGDTFWQLAERFGTSAGAIQTANPNLNPLSLPIGTKVTIPLGFTLTPTDIDYTYLLVTYIVEGLAMRYPFIRVDSIGKSVMGKQLHCLSLGSGRKEVFYNAAHHANEWITTPVLLKYIEELSLASASNSVIGGYNAKELLKEAKLYVVPLVNPDGVDLVTGALDDENTFYADAKTISADYPNIPFTQGWKANIVGVDLNLNYPANWEEAKEIKFAQGFTTPAPRDFVGLAPLSAPESRAMHDFTLQHEFALTLSYHTQGEVIYWKYLEYNPQNSEKIAKAFAEVSGYSPELTPLTSAYAGYKDWFIQTYNKPGYTIEAGKGQNPLPLSRFDKIYRDNVGILTLGMVLS